MSSSSSSNVKVDYKFRNEADFKFYILNAVAHDFIHDFNNYGRMGKILEYIKGLVRDAGFAYIDVRAAESISADVAVPDAAIPVAAIPVAAVPGAEEISSDTIRSDAEEQTVLRTLSDGDATKDTDITPITKDDRTLNADSNITADIRTEDMYQAQMEQNFQNEPIKNIATTVRDRDTSLLVGIANTNIDAYNQLTTPSATASRTRSTTKKLHALQRLKDFVQEGVFLVISKLHGGDRVRSIGGKKIKQKGGSGIDIISKSVIIDTIKDIIGEINEIRSDSLIPLANFFEYMMYSFSYLSISNISPLEILNNSLIEENASIFIVGQCNPTNINEQARLCLTALLLSSDTASGILDKAKGILEKIPSELTSKKELLTPKMDILSSKMSLPNLSIQRGYPKSRIPYTKTPYRAFGGAFNVTEYNKNKDNYKSFKEAIATFKSTSFYTAYTTTYNDIGMREEYFAQYTTFIEPFRQIITSIAGTQTFNVKDAIIRKCIENARRDAERRGRNLPKYFQEMCDTIKDLIITKTIGKFEDVASRETAVMEISGETSTSFTRETRTAVQKVSQLIAKKVLELTGTRRYDIRRDLSTTDLLTQVDILNTVANGSGYTGVDDKLIEYFIHTYGTDNNGRNNNPNIRVNQSAITNLKTRIDRCNKTTCRVINNAISAVPSVGGELKGMISNIVVCPTSSICDGMGAFGSCVPPKNKEYANMNFMISYQGEHGNSYYGQTNIKPDKTSVNINYGYNCEDLSLYNSIVIKIDTQPIVLEANYVFKNLINQIITIWKSQSSVRDIDTLWSNLEHTDYFISVLELGSQKAVGDIFQEINSTLENGGYNVEVQNFNRKQTYGLMGDRPSGVRIIKLLKDAERGVNPNASGGYVYDNNTSIVYFSPPPPRTGGKMTRKRQNKIKTTKSRRHVNRFTKKRRNKTNRTK
jgi:hypothetical protein